MLFRPRHSTTFLAALAAAVVGVLGALPALAQVDLGLEVVQETGLATGDIRLQIARIIRAFMGLLGIIATILILYAGFLWMTAGGDEGKVERAKSVMKNAVIGLVIVLSAFGIASFAINAITGGQAGVGAGGCPPGQTCSTPGTIGGGSGGALRVTGIAPAGAGPNSGGWPKNYALTIGFSSNINAATVTDATVRVQRCNARVNGAGTPQPFAYADCGTAVSGTRITDGRRIRFQPDATPGTEPTDFEGNFWYMVTLGNGPSGIRDASGRVLVCPFPLLGGDDYSSPSMPSDACVRAMAFNDLRDVQPPTISITSPSSPPNSCGAPPLLPVNVLAQDDFLVAEVEVLLNGGTHGLVDINGDSFTGAAVGMNAAGANPFRATGVFVDASVLTPGESYTLTAIAYDGVPQASAPATRTLAMAPAHCCNGVLDSAEGETGIDCGGPASGCGYCSGNACTGDADCQSGTCDPATNTCVERPIIMGVDAWDGGPDTFVTLTGVHFGMNGSVTFLGDPANPDDDRVAQACAPAAWTPTQVVVAVPEGAVSGPLMLVSTDGRWDDTTAASPPGVEGSFTVTTQTRPGLCYLQPWAGASGSTVLAHGSGFGATMGTSPNESAGFLGTHLMNVASGGWSSGAVSFIVPSMHDGAYHLRMRIGGATAPFTNALTYTVRPGAGDRQPVIVAVTPTSGPSGQLITITGSGFGNRRGVVRFFNGPISGDPEIAVGGDPMCDDSWTDTVVTVRVPNEYQSAASVAPGAHVLRVETAAPSRTSNTIPFTVNTAPVAPGICSMSPLVGPPGTIVTVRGEGFGPGSAVLPPAGGAMEFFNGASPRMPATAYAGWTPSEVRAAVPGSQATVATWPQTGPVTILANNVRSANAIPFQVANCTAQPDVCSEGTQCCADGACRTSCALPALTGAYGFTFSTETLPALPRVVERAMCTASLLQSPSPARNSRDACLNAVITLEISRDIESSSVTSDTVLVTACGSGPSADCAAGTAVNITARAVSLGSGAVITATPSSGMLAPDTWYRVTLVSDPASGVGIYDANNGQYLDGDLDRVAGGNYSYTFRTRAGEAACELASVVVAPSAYTITHDGLPPSVPGGTEGSEGTPGFLANLLAANCNPLSCSAGGAPQYNVRWHASDSTTLNPAPGAPAFDATHACSEPVRFPVIATRETPPGSPVALTAHVWPQGSTLTRSGRADVTVAFADPVVTHRFPDCDEACVNAEIGADFNVRMDVTTLTTTNIRIERCRNASCNPPYASSSRPGITSLEPTVDATGFRINPSNLVASSYYKVILEGGEGGIRSASGVALTGLNEADTYVWTFRTKSDATACRPFRTSVEPAIARMSYVGERQDFRATPFGAPDACSATGQRLAANEHDWRWGRVLDLGIPATLRDRSPSVSHDGFVTTQSAGPFFAVATVPASIDTSTSLPMGCSADCRLIGSQTTRPQCGNGILEQGEACERDDFASGRCSQTTCLWLGAAGLADGGTCGNGTIEAGEECEAVTADGAFPPGCIAPSPGVAGCLLTGALTGAAAIPNAQCGNGLIEDGEQCDDGNRSNGDGCSAECRLEGSLPSCVNAGQGQACVNFCGNGIVEPGEEAVCEGPGGPSAHGCDVNRCILLGTPHCTGPTCAAADGVCGNGRFDRGEHPSCDTPNGIAPGCTDRCVLAGSSYRYATPSFCGDGVVGTGEHAACEATPPAGGNGDIDPYQAYQTSGMTAAEGTQTVTTVSASVDGVNPANTGTARVELSCTCGSLGAAGSAFCQDIATASGVDGLSLMCNTQGCCAPSPSVTMVSPSGNGVCRNAEVRVVFTQDMDSGSMEQNLFVGVHAPSGECANGQLALSGFGGADLASAPRPFWVRAWSAVSEFFRSVFAPAASAQQMGGAAGAVPGSDARFCVVPGRVTVAGNTATWSPLAAFQSEQWHQVLVRGGDGGVRSSTGTPMPMDYRSSFGTGTQVCAVDRVSIAPSAWLFTTAEDLGNATTAPAADAIDGDHEFIARAHPAGASSDITLASVPEYAFKWNWHAQPDVSVITLDVPFAAPIETNGFCEVGEDANSPDCSVVLSTPPPTPDPTNGVCEPGETPETANGCAEKRGQTQEAWVTVRTEQTGFPRNGEAVVRVTADIAEDGGTVKRSVPGTSQVTVMLCNNPWPARRMCARNPNTNQMQPTVPGSNVFGLPWDSSATCEVEGPYWTPFVDPLTNISFSYCRDAAPGSSAALLPALREDAIFVQPGGNILREYLFPMRVGNDAIGLRVAMNLEHWPVMEWYRRQGFLGNPQTTTVDGYAALREGRTTYVNAGTFVAPFAALHTNVNVLSYSAGASPETVAVYDRILESINLNANITDLGYCVLNGEQALFDADSANVSSMSMRHGFNTSQGAPVACSADAHCWRNPATGAALAAEFYTDGSYQQALRCAVPAAKLTRDVERWSDLHNLRGPVLAAATLPTLESGTFLRGMTTSAWDSWTTTFGSAVGFTPPSDPVNRFAYCAGADLDTCWNEAERTYQCPAGSHIYSVRSIGGQDFSVAMDMETACTRYTNRGTCEAFEPLCAWSGSSCVAAGQWSGTTCLELNQASCTGRTDCAWQPQGSGGFCTYARGAAMVGGLSGHPFQCFGERQSPDAGFCGDGIVQPDEACDPGAPLPPPIACGTGVQQNTCSLTCTVVEGACHAGFCGDGIRNGNEVCDDGSLNGQYGRCNTQCSGYAFRCGDNVVQPGEACDDGVNNGQYGQCAWDCSGPGPRCGDGVRNGTEVCDTETQISRGFCAGGPVPSFAPCSSSADCAISQESCVGIDSDPMRMNIRTCNPPTAHNACDWGGWTLTAPGQCGNGALETGEQCDDGIIDSRAGDAGACVIDPIGGVMCRANVCGDGYLNIAGGEQCDDGVLNGQECTPEYGRTCNYCTSSCTIATRTGGFCGDGVINGAEQCEPGVAQVRAAGTSGAEADWWTGFYICRDTRQEYQSWGRIVAQATCNPNTCQWTCAETPHTNLCRNVGAVNTDRDGVIAGLTIDFRRGLNNTQLLFSNWLTRDFPGMEAPAAATTLYSQLGRAAVDQCDYDKDGDGVPDAFDCSPLDHRVHGAYTYGSIVIPAAADDCDPNTGLGDGLDNNCDGIPDNGLHCVSPSCGNGICDPWERMEYGADSGLECPIPEHLQSRFLCRQDCGVSVC